MCNRVRVVLGILLLTGLAAPAAAQPMPGPPLPPRGDLHLTVAMGAGAVHLGSTPGFHYLHDAPAVDVTLGLRYDLTPRVALALLEFRGAAVWLQHRETERYRTLGKYFVGVGTELSPVTRPLHVALHAGAAFAGWARPTDPSDPFSDEVVDRFTGAGVGVAGSVTYDFLFVGPVVMGVEGRVAYDRLLTPTDGGLPPDHLVVSLGVAFALDLRHFFRVARRSPAPP